MNHKNFIAVVTALAFGIAGLSAVPAQANSYGGGHSAEAAFLKVLGATLTVKTHKKHHDGHFTKRHHGHAKSHFKRHKKHRYHYGKRYKRHHKYGYKRHHRGKYYRY